jgi:hypothetical protein
MNNTEIEQSENQRKINRFICEEYLKSRGLIKSPYLTHYSESESVGDGYAVSDAIACLIKENESLRADINELKKKLYKV